MSEDNVLVIENLRKEYPLPHGSLCVFEQLNFELGLGELVAVMGVSGVGKTTLLNLCGALDHPNSGRILLSGENIFDGNEQKKAFFRNTQIGFIFQFFHLLPEFTSIENIYFPLLIQGVSRRKAHVKSRRLLEEVGLLDKADLRPSQLSGGEQQRVAVARALINEPRLLLADEPTGNLDWMTGKKILELVKNLHRKKDLSSIIVTHSEKVAEFCDKIYLMESGQLKRLTQPGR
jgi:ABC-type lipoprotein export system ATPase subunit